jgi:hypothetical protein
MRSPRYIALLAAALLVAVPVPSARAGGYAVSACFGSENASWSEWEPTPGATAYVACPGGVVDLARPQSGQGMVVRNVAGPLHALRGTTAALTFDAPGGTTISGVDFDARLLANPGWRVGLFDATHGAWLWCGVGCSSTIEQWFHKELRGLATQRIQALVRCDAPRCRSDVRHGVLALRQVRVYLADESAPSVGGARGGLASGDGWLRGVQELGFDASDNGGIRLGRVELDGAAVHEDRRPCDDTRPVPCPNGSIGALLDTRTWADGGHALRFGAMDAAGNWTWSDRAVRVDNTPPDEPSPALDGGADWNASRARALVVSSPGGQAAPLARARVKMCRSGGGCEESAPALTPGGASTAGGSAAARAPLPADGSSDAGTVPVTASDGPGEYAVRVALEDAAGNVGPYAPPVTLRFDDARPGAPDVSAADRWQGGGALPLDAEGERPLSGIRGYRVRIGGLEAVVATSLPLDELPEGGTPIEVGAVSGSGVESTAVRTTLRLDRTPPVVTASGVPSPDAWSRDPVRIALRARDQAALSGVASLAWSLDGGEEELHEGDEATVEIASDGRHAVGYRALDGAGNSSIQHAASVRVDRTPPETIAFEAADAADPTRLSVMVADATSGVAGGRVELRRGGAAWQRIATSLEGGRLVARLDDATLRAGAYELRAVVSDVAGNEATGRRRVDGTPAVVTLPLRRRTVLAVRRSGRRLSARLTSGGHSLPDRDLAAAQRLRGGAKWRAVCGRRTVVVTRTGTSASAPRTARAHPQPSAQCSIRTDGAGRVDMRLPSGPSRTIRISFAGDALLLPARARVVLRTRARARLHASPRTVAAGGAVRFSGRLVGAHVPAGGKLVELQALVGAGWRTFATLRSDRRGRFHHVHRFSPLSGGRTYSFRVRVPRESAYPFERATTRAVAVRVT